MNVWTGPSASHIGEETVNFEEETKDARCARCLNDCPGRPRQHLLKVNDAAGRVEDLREGERGRSTRLGRISELERTHVQILR